MYDDPGEQVKYLVICPSGKWQIPIIREAKSRGLSTIAVDEDSNAAGFKHADYVVNAALEDTTYITDEIKKVTHKIIGAISFCSDKGISLAQKLNREFQCSPKLIFNSDNATNKINQRNLWKRRNIPQPEFQSFTNPQEAIVFGTSVTFPIVIKPSDSSGSRGVTIVSHADEVKGAVEYAFKFSTSGKIIVEDFIDGLEYTVEVLAIDSKVHVLLVTQKVQISNDNCVVSRELRTISPQHHSYKQISSLAKSAFESLGLSNGPGHLEMIVNQEAGTAGVVEAAFRGGGFNLADRLVEVATSFDLTKACLVPFMNDRINPGEITYRPSTLFFQPTRKGKLIGISGLEQVKKIPGVEIEILGTLGKLYDIPRTDGDRLCTIIATASTDSELDLKKSQIEGLLEFRFEEI